MLKVYYVYNHIVEIIHKLINMNYKWNLINKVQQNSLKQGYHFLNSCSCDDITNYCHVYDSVNGR